MKIKVYNKFSESLYKIWKNLENKGNYTVFQNYYWQKNWYDRIGRPNNYILNIILLEDSDKNYMILPFVIKSRFGVRVLSFLGGNQTDYNSAIYSKSFKKEKNKDYWNIIFPNLQTFDLMKLTNLKNLDSYSFLLPNKNSDTINCEISNFTKLSDTWEKHQLKLRKKFIQDTTRQKNRLKKLGNLNFSIIDLNDKEYFKFLDVLINQKEKRYLSTGAYNNFKSTDVENFYKNMVNPLGNKSFIHFSVLKLNSEIIATHWGLFDDKTFFYLMPSFSDRWNKYSPGKIQLEYLIKWCIDKKFSFFDFTIGSETYKKEWCDQELKLYEFRFPKNYRGRLYLIIQDFRTILKEIPIILKGFRILRKIKNLISK